MSSPADKSPRDAPCRVRRVFAGLFGRLFVHVKQRHLFDYNTAATRLWLALAASGLLAVVKRRVLKF